MTANQRDLSNRFGVFDRMMLSGDSGAIIVSRSNGNIHLYGGKADALDNHLIIEVSSSEQEHFTLEMEHFLDYVQKGVPCICDGVNERESLAVVVGGFASMKTGKEVKCYSRTL